MNTGFPRREALNIEREIGREILVFSLANSILVYKFSRIKTLCFHEGNIAVDIPLY